MCFFLLLGVTTLEAAAEEVIATVVARHLRTTDVAAVATLDRDRAPDHTVRVHQTPQHIRVLYLLCLTPASCLCSVHCHWLGL